MGGADGTIVYTRVFIRNQIDMGLLMLVIVTAILFFGWKFGLFKWASQHIFTRESIKTIWPEIKRDCAIFMRPDNRIYRFFMGIILFSLVIIFISIGLDG